MAAPRFPTAAASTFGASPRASGLAAAGAIRDGIFAGSLRRRSRAPAGRKEAAARVAAPELQVVVRLAMEMGLRRGHLTSECS